MQLAKKTGIPSDWTKYIQHKNITQELVRQAYWNYVNSILNKSLEHGNKPFWKYIQACRDDNIDVAVIKNNGFLYHIVSLRQNFYLISLSQFLLWMMTQVISHLCHIQDITTYYIY